MKPDDVIAKAKKLGFDIISVKDSAELGSVFKIAIDAFKGEKGW
jgi:hypothetical protein